MASMVEEIRSRRAVLLGALGGAGMAIAHALGRPLPVRAETDPNAVHKNVNNPTTGITTVTSSGNTAIKGVSSIGSGAKSGVFGQGTQPTGRGVTGLGPVGVWGQSAAASGNGLRGVSSGGTSTAVFADATAASGTPIGAFGRSKAPNGFGVVGRNMATTGKAVGVFGESKSADGIGVLGKSPPGPGIGHGVEGISDSAAGVGVRARAFGVDGRGVLASATEVGVQGDGRIGVAGIGDLFGVVGSATDPNGIGGSFSAGGPTGFALATDGPVRFDCAGLATIASGSSSVPVTPGVPLAAATSKVLCTLMGDPGAPTLHRVSIDSATQFTIRLTGNAGSNTKVAWFVIS